mmetsp:Transcript_140069/g.349047  ORF Transcript_140069/g.349047 Transcript_140069/m.349047 type:complete len:210 (-) Transcript_140069:11-640(-)
MVSFAEDERDKGEEEEREVGASSSSPRRILHRKRSWASSEALSPVQIPTPMKGRVALPRAVMEKEKLEAKAFEDALAKAWEHHEAQQAELNAEVICEEEDEAEDEGGEAEEDEDDEGAGEGSRLLHRLASGFWGRYLVRPVLWRLGADQSCSAESSGWGALCFPPGAGGGSAASASGSGGGCRGGPVTVVERHDEIVLESTHSRGVYGF